MKNTETALLTIWRLSILMGATETAKQAAKDYDALIKAKSGRRVLR